MSSSTDYLPTREADLNQWAKNFDEKITAAPTEYGLTAAQATAFNALYTAFTDAWGAANANSTRTPSVIVTKNDAKQALIDGDGGIRKLVKIIQAYPGTTDTERSDLGLTIPDTGPTPVPAPAEAPQLDVVARFNRTIKIRLHDASSPTSRGKPATVATATVFWAIGPAAPADMTGWTFYTNTGKTVVDVEFPDTVAAGAQVWITAFWSNAKGESGPACAAVGTFIDSAAGAAAAA